MRAGVVRSVSNKVDTPIKGKTTLENIRLSPAPVLVIVKHPWNRASTILTKSFEWTSGSTTRPDHTAELHHQWILHRVINEDARLPAGQDSRGCEK